MAAGNLCGPSHRCSGCRHQIRRRVSLASDNMDKQGINTVSLKLPTFWPHNPRSWFIQAEAQFGIRNITADETKYWYVVASLDQDSSSRCICFLESAPKTEKYRALKRYLIETFDLTGEERADRLLNLQQLGDRRPSEVADLMLQLNGSAGQHFLLRRIFMRALPPAVRNAISTSPTADLRDLAHEADRAMASVPAGAIAASSFEFLSTHRAYATSIADLALGLTDVVSHVIGTLIYRRTTRETRGGARASSSFRGPPLFRSAIT